MQEIPRNNVVRIIKNRTNVFDEKTCDLVLVDIKILIPLSQYIVEKRLENSKKLLDLYIDNKIDLYKSVYLTDNSKKKMLAPPIVEYRDGLYFICDGMHRIYTAMQSGVTSLNVLLVRNPTLPLPGRPLTWADVKITKTNKNVSEVFVSYEENGYTGYSMHLNNSQYFT